MEAVGADDEVERFVGQGQVRHIGLKPKDVVFLVLLDRLVQHPRTEVGCDDVKARPASQEPSLQLAGSSGHVENVFVTPTI